MKTKLQLVYTQEDMSNAATLANSLRLLYPILPMAGAHTPGVLPDFFAGGWLGQRWESGVGFEDLLSCYSRHPKVIFQYQLDMFLVIIADPTVAALAGFNAQWFR